GDLYLKNTSALICHTFQHSPVFRIGGDEFAVILENESCFSRDTLAKVFCKKCEDTCAVGTQWWDQVRVSMGVAAYDPSDDRTVDDVARRADKLMYENKHARKAGR
ncbi:MAG: diguanylate cyclase, partial [Clostridia bacterium]|nr:diguanylate cyclase [Clostridia bacterium]